MFLANLTLHTKHDEHEVDKFVNKTFTKDSQLTEPEWDDQEALVDGLTKNEFKKRLMKWCKEELNIVFDVTNDIAYLPNNNEDYRDIISDAIKKEQERCAALATKMGCQVLAKTIREFND